MGITTGSSLGPSIGTSEIELSSISNTLLQQNIINAGNLNTGTLVKIFESTTSGSDFACNITGLSGFKHYLLRAQIVASGGTNSEVRLFPNGSQGTFTTELSSIAAGATTYSSTSTIRLCKIASGSTGTFRSEIFNNSGMSASIITDSFDNLGSPGARVSAASFWSNSGAITSLLISTTSDMILGAGSKIQLYEYR